MSVVVELRHSPEQTAFNLRRWEEVHADRALARLPHRIETDRRGEIGAICLSVGPEICVEIMSPSNTKGELEEKAALYFEAGAKEVCRTVCHNAPPFTAVPDDGPTAWHAYWPISTSDFKHSQPW